MNRLHHDEVPIDRALAARLLAEQHPDLGGRQLSRLELQGTDNVVFRLGDDLSLRLPRRASAVPGVLVELQWLPRLAPQLPLPVPEPIARGEPSDGYPFPWSVCRWVDGTQTAGSLAEFHDETMDALAEVTALMSAGRVEPDLFDPVAARELWTAAVDAPAWPGDGVWVHRDLYADNLLTVDGTLTGIVDFGGLVVGDPAGDVMAAWHLFSPPHRDTFLRIVGTDAPTQLRARAWVLSQGLLALPYYLDSHQGMVRMARRAITAALDSPS